MQLWTSHPRIISFLHLKSKRKQTPRRIYATRSKNIARDAGVPLSRLSFIGRPRSIAIRPGTGCDTARDAASCRSKGGVKKRFTTSFRHDPFSISTYSAIRASNYTSPFSFSRFRRSLHLLSTFSRTTFDSRNLRDARNANYRDPPWIKVSSVFERTTPPFSIDPLNFKRNTASKVVIFFVARWPATVRLNRIPFDWICLASRRMNFDIGVYRC